MSSANHKNNPQPDARLDKLPVWAQDHITNLQRQRDVAVKRLDEMTDAQTPAPFWYDENDYTNPEGGPVSRRVYIQTHKIEVSHAAVSLTVQLRENVIDLSWDGREKHVCFQPKSFQQAYLIAKENMR